MKTTSFYDKTAKLICGATYWHISIQGVFFCLTFKKLYSFHLIVYCYKRVIRPTSLIRKMEKDTRKMHFCTSYLINKLDTVVPLQRLDCHSSGIDQLCQVDGLGRVHSSQIDQVLQPLQRQRLVLRSPTEEESKSCC